MQLRSIVAVVGSPSRPQDVALTQAQQLAQWYEAELHVVSDGSVRGIADTAGRLGADLIVVRKDVRRSSHWLAGSFATAIGKAAGRPTIAVPNGWRRQASPDAPFRKLVAAVDFSEASFRALAEALALVQESGGHLTLLHVLDGFPYETVYSASHAFRLVRGFHARVDQVNDELRSLIPDDARHWAEIDVDTVPGQAAAAIAGAAVSRRADLIVVGLPQRPRLEEFVAGSTVHRVARRADTPLLLVPGPSTPRAFRPVGDGDCLPARPASASEWRDINTFTRAGEFNGVRN